MWESQDCKRKNPVFWFYYKILRQITYKPRKLPDKEHDRFTCPAWYKWHVFGKYLDSLGVQRNCASFSYIHGGLHRESN